MRKKRTADINIYNQYEMETLAMEARIAPEDFEWGMMLAKPEMGEQYITVDHNQKDPLVHLMVNSPNVKNVETDSTNRLISPVISSVVSIPIDENLTAEDNIKQQKNSMFFSYTDALK